MFASSTPPAHALELGAVVDDRYRVSRLTHSNASSQVYAATHLLLGRAVTLEILVRDDERARRRFRRAARLLSMMKHPNVVQLHDMGRHEGMPYLVREHLGGQTLSQRSAMRGPMKVAEFLPIAQQLLSALGYIHQRKTIHRDVSGDNVVFAETWDGGEFLKLTQFGFSKELGSGSGTTTAAEQQRLVQSLTHVAPEQILRPEEVDHRVDLYAAGAVFYQLLSGVRPFQADTLAQLGSDILERPPMPLGQLVDHVSPQLDEVILTSLAKDPDDRFQSAYELWQALTTATQS